MPTSINLLIQSTLTIPELEKDPAKISNQAIFTCRTEQKFPGRQQKKFNLACQAIVLAEEAENRSLTLRSKSQRVEAKLLACLQCQQVGAFLVQVSKREFNGTTLQRIGQVFCEI